MSTYQSDQFGRSRSVVLSKPDRRSTAMVPLALSLMAFVPAVPAVGAWLGWVAGGRARRSGAAVPSLARVAVVLGVLFTAVQLAAGVWAMGPGAEQVRSALAF